MNIQYGSEIIYVFIYIYLIHTALYEFSTVCSNENETIVKCKDLYQLWHRHDDKIVDKM